MDLLPQVSFSILLALSLKPRHGYEIMKQVEEDSEGKIKLGPGALYSSIKLLLSAKLIKEVQSTSDIERRRYYELAPEGWVRLNKELDYFKAAVELSKKRTVQGLARA
jgi:DNA-binding PadR family transcriptional regulator